MFAQAGAGSSSQLGSAGQLAGGSSQLPGASHPIGSNIHNSAPAAPLGATAGPLSPGTPNSYDMFSAGNMYRGGASAAGSNLESKLSLDFLRDTDSSEQVVDLFKHLNL